MRPGRLLSLSLGCAALAGLWFLAPRPTPPTPARHVGSPARLVDVYGGLPIAFEANLGQVDGAVAFAARGPGHTLYAAPDALVLALAPPVGPPRPVETTEPAEAATEPAGIAETSEIANPAEGPRGGFLRIRFTGASTPARIEAEERLDGSSNYLIGNDPARWRVGVPRYRRVRYRELYPGIDLVLHGSRGELEYDFEVRPGADPDVIALELEGAEQVELDEAGNLVARTAVGEVVHLAPLIYERVAGGRRAVEGGYALSGRRVHFRIGARDPEELLVIDPVLRYSTFVGGNGLNWGFGVAVDAAGNAYVAGATTATDFPTAGSPFAGSFSGGSPWGDAFVAKLNAVGSDLVYSTYLGGTGDDQALGIDVDAAGNVYVTGRTGSTDFPTRNAVQGSFAGGNSSSTGGDVFVARLNADGSDLDYSTYLGGVGNEEGKAIDVRPSGEAYVVGQTTSTDFPTAVPLQSACNGGCIDLFLSILDANGPLLYSTFLGGSNVDHARDVAVGEDGAAWIIGLTSSDDFPTTAGAVQGARAGDFDAFVVRIDAGGGLGASTYLGGSASDAPIVGTGSAIALGPGGDVWAFGDTESTDFPTTPGALQPSLGGVGAFGGGDAFVTRLDPGLTALRSSTYLGGSDLDISHGIAVDPWGNAWVVGETNSTDFPTAAALQPSGAGQIDAFVAVVNPSGTRLISSTYLGGGNSDVAEDIVLAVDGRSAYVVGMASDGFPTTPGAFQTVNGGAFVAKLATALDFFIAAARPDFPRTPAAPPFP